MGSEFDVKNLALLLSPLVLGACQYGGPVESLQPQTSREANQARLDAASHDPLAFAQAACGGCHAVEPEWLSPNSEAPTFAAIANQSRLTGETLSNYLKDAHNYPEAMDFELTAEHVDQLTVYILSLRSGDFKPMP